MKLHAVTEKTIGAGKVISWAILAKKMLESRIQAFTIKEIACDNDLGEGNIDGYKLLNWLEATGRSYPIRIFTSNPVVRERMIQTIHHNHWTMVGGA